ncbi:MAG: NAD(P)H-dependent glycerol-3-phosphate dehydrogenase [Kiloniellales bacterium]|nr:NAD(P)H-dependent glycerol-3-phosphate dehydrogenase [Kiloniellales bacterium]
MTIKSIAVVGAGAFGTSLAIATARAGTAVFLWARRQDLARELDRERVNGTYLPGIEIPEDIRIASDPECLSEAEAILFAVPSQHLRALANQVKGSIRPDAVLVSCAKGIEQESLKFPSDVLGEVLPGHPLAVLSGPTFAKEVAMGLPSAITLAVDDRAAGTRLVEAIGSKCFRPYLSHDLIGAQVGGAVKNVLAIACGIVQGRTLGDNARAALITRGLAEITRLGQALGGKPETLMGLSGLGDLTLTCSAMQSRNFSLGVALGEGRTLEDVLAERKSVTEGVYSAAGVVRLAARHELDMPISFAADAILNKNASVEATIDKLLARPFKSE